MIGTANYPKNQVLAVVAAEDIPGVKTIKTKCLGSLPRGMAYHADLQLFHLGGIYTVACPSVYAYYKEKLEPLGFSVLCGEKEVRCTYPADAAYNILRIGNYAICNEKNVDKGILRLLWAQDVKIIHVRQGYARCAALPVGENALITSDEGIAGAAEKAGLEVLRILPGEIILPGYPYGFIGGTAGMISRDEMFFAGDIGMHPAAENIESFLLEHHIRIRKGNGKLRDIGSVLPLYIN